MGYDLYATNPQDPEKAEFHMGAFSFPVILEFTSYLYPACFAHGQWYMAWEGSGDDRFDGKNYPPCLNNDGFEVSDEEAKIMARFARNWVRVQKTLPEENRSASLFEGEKGRTGVKKEDVLALLASGGHKGPWPVKIRDDFVEKIAEFAEWAEQSGGFEIR